LGKLQRNRAIIQKATFQVESKDKRRSGSYEKVVRVVNPITRVKKKNGYEGKYKARKTGRNLQGTL